MPHKLNIALGLMSIVVRPDTVTFPNVPLTWSLLIEASAPHNLELPMQSLKWILIVVIPCSACRGTMPLNIPSYCALSFHFTTHSSYRTCLVAYFATRNWIFSLQLIFYFYFYLASYVLHHQLSTENTFVVDVALCSCKIYVRKFSFTKSRVLDGK